MPIPEFVVEIRKMIGHHEMWLPGVTAVVTRRDEILLVRRADNGEWTPITGIPEPGEEPGRAAAREALEETGVEVSVDRLASTRVSWRYPIQRKMSWAWPRGSSSGRLAQ